MFFRRPLCGNLRVVARLSWQSFTLAIVFKRHWVVCRSRNRITSVPVATKSTLARRHSAVRSPAGIGGLVQDAIDAVTKFCRSTNTYSSLARQHTEHVNLGISDLTWGFAAATRLRGKSVDCQSVSFCGSVNPRRSAPVGSEAVDVQ